VCHSIICAAPDYLARHGTPRKVEDGPAQLPDALLWGAACGSSIRQARAAGQSVAVGGSISANEVTVLLQAVLAGVGIGHMPAYSVAPLVASGQLVQLLPEYEPLQLGMYGVYASRKHMPATCGPCWISWPSASPASRSERQVSG
jgi:DNA-binding transcriptional LysR family regulator